MILRLTDKTAALIGESPGRVAAPRQARVARWTSGPRNDEGGLRELASELGVPVREEGVVSWKRERLRAPHP
jgi:hypothetical protein